MREAARAGLPLLARWEEMPDGHRSPITMGVAAGPAGAPRVGLYECVTKSASHNIQVGTYVRWVGIVFKRLYNMFNAAALTCLAACVS